VSAATPSHRLLRIVFAVSLAIVAGRCAEAAEVSSDMLYRAAMSAKAAGDFPAAARDLERILAREPDNVDALLQLALVDGFQRRFDEARSLLRRAAALAPADLDVTLALARIDAYSGRFDAAEAGVAAVLARDPANLEALTLAGRVAYYQRRLGDARRRFDAVLARAPGDPDALTGLGDVLAAQGDAAAARDAYREAQIKAPNSAEIAARLANLEQPSAPSFRLDTSVSYSHLSRQKQHDWEETFDQLSYRLSDRTTIHGRIEASERFGEFDTYLEGGIDHRFDDVRSGYFYLGGTPDSQFRERIAAATGGTLRLARGGDAFGPTLALLDTRVADYSTGDVELVMPGIQQYALKNRVWLTAKGIATRDENGRWQGGWFLRGDAAVGDGLTFYAGLADAAETSDGITAETRTQFAGAVVTLSDRYALRIDYAHEDRHNSYVRQAVTLGLSATF
jgi:YaiO family outer membrane protein